jgi:DNA-binding MurR/RpiR family transcriptional regulator
MTEPILSQRILDAYDELTRRERRLADLLLEDLDTLVLKSATEISEKAGVSKATTARFFRRLGYPSFKAAQAAARTKAEGRKRRACRSPRRRRAEPGPLDRGASLG